MSVMVVMVIGMVVKKKKNRIKKMKFFHQPTTGRRATAEGRARRNVSANADRNPAAADRKPATASRNPTTADRNPAAADRNPVAADSNPVAATNNQTAAVASFDNGGFCDDDDCDCICEEECCPRDYKEKVVDRHADCFIPNFVEYAVAKRPSVCVSLW